MSTQSDINRDGAKGCAAARPGLWGRLLADDRGAIAVEYILILIVFVIPVALLLPRFLSMINFYAQRITSLYPLPFP